MTFTISAEWHAGMELECEDRRGQQVYCTTRDPGLQWIKNFDDLPPQVRSRLAQSRFNLCPACVKMEAQRAAGSGRRLPPVPVFLAIITAIEAAIAAGRSADSLEDFK
jgi:hypothetical protein